MNGTWGRADETNGCDGLMRMRRCVARAMAQVMGSGVGVDVRGGEIGVGLVGGACWRGCGWGGEKVEMVEEIGGDGEGWDW